MSRERERSLSLCEKSGEANLEQNRGGEANLEQMGHGDANLELTLNLIENP